MPTSDIRAQLEAFRNLRPGEVLWVQVSEEDAQDDALLEILRDAVMDVVGAEVGVLVTPSNLIEKIQVLSLPELLQLQEIIEGFVGVHLRSTHASLEVAEG